MKIKGLSIISHVFKKAEEANIGEVIVAAEDQEIVDDVKQNGGQAILTKNEHKTGTDRIYEVFQKINSADIDLVMNCLLYTSPSPRDMRRSRMPSSA